MPKINRVKHKTRTHSQTLALGSSGRSATWEVQETWGDTELRDTEAKAGGLATIVPLLGPLFGAAYR